MSADGMPPKKRQTTGKQVEESNGAAAPNTVDGTVHDSLLEEKESE